MKKIVLLAIVSSFALTACGQAPIPQQQAQVVPIPQVEQEDCDFDDMLERDEDCGFKKKKKKKTAYAVAPTYTKPTKPISYSKPSYSAPSYSKPSMSRSSFSSRSSSSSRRR